MKSWRVLLKNWMQMMALWMVSPSSASPLEDIDVPQYKLPGL
jgi:hypothetical protein